MKYHLMNNLTKTLLLISFITLNLKINAQKTPTDYIDVFFETYSSKNTDMAFDSLFKTNNFITKEDVDTIKGRITQYSELLGEYNGFELIIKKNIGQSIEVHSYIIKYERQPLRFIFTFYNPSNKWKIYNFRLNDDFIEELENATIEFSYKQKF